MPVFITTAFRLMPAQEQQVFLPFQTSRHVRQCRVCEKNRANSLASKPSQRAADSQRVQEVLEDIERPPLPWSKTPNLYDLGNTKMLKWI